MAVLQLKKTLVKQGPFSLRADWAVESGGRIALMGPSGAGKSTVLGALAGFLAVAEGHFWWAGEDFTFSPPSARPLSILFQDQNLFPHLTVAQNVGLGLRPDLRLGAAGWDQVAAALARVGLAGFGQRRPGELSGGQASRVALARILLRERPLLLLDEPFAALGPAMKDEMLDLVAEITGEAGTTVLLVTHDPADARAFAEEIVVVADGIAQPPRGTRDVLNEKGGPLAAYLGSR